ncbi:MAG: FHA domain-containing protein, partial [Kiritimatiellae bacterium]|nr:FHA domain-containing protein [Kiritimatiellia bacterium]
MTKLVFIGAEGAPEVPIPPAGVTFGRAPDCDLPIQEGSVSGHHGSLRFEGGRWWLHDNNSSNGSFVNGQRIADSPLNNGDTLSKLTVNNTTLNVAAALAGDITDYVSNSAAFSV